MPRRSLAATTATRTHDCRPQQHASSARADRERLRASRDGRGRRGDEGPGGAAAGGAAPRASAPGLPPGIPAQDDRRQGRQGRARAGAAGGAGSCSPLAPARRLTGPPCGDHHYVAMPSAVTSCGRHACRAPLVPHTCSFHTQTAHAFASPTMQSEVKKLRALTVKDAEGHSTVVDAKKLKRNQSRVLLESVLPDPDAENIALLRRIQERLARWGSGRRLPRRRRPQASTVPAAPAPHRSATRWLGCGLTTVCTLAGRTLELPIERAPVFPRRRRRAGWAWRRRPSRCGTRICAWRRWPPWETSRSPPSCALSRTPSRCGGGGGVRAVSG